MTASGHDDGRSTRSVAAAPAQASLEDLQADLTAGQLDREASEARDETRAEAQDRMRAEQLAARRREQLSGQHASAAYRRIARRSRNLTDREFRVLDTLLGFSTRLANCFPGRQALRRAIGGKVRTLGRLDAIRRSLERKGWIRRVTLREGDRVALGDDGLLDDANETGRFISATGYVFCIPAGEIARGDVAWEGPHNFANRVFGQRRLACSTATDTKRAELRAV